MQQKKIETLFRWFRCYDTHGSNEKKKKTHILKIWRGIESCTHIIIVRPLVTLWILIEYIFKLYFYFDFQVFHGCHSIALSLGKGFHLDAVGLYSIQMKFFSFPTGPWHTQYFISMGGSPSYLLVHAPKLLELNVA